MSLWDISPTLHPGIAVWPGDVPLSRTVALSMANGAHLDLSSLTTTVHVGAHADAPSHYVEGGETIATRDLSHYLGPCQVMAVDVPRGTRILPEHLPGPVTAPRVLLRTESFPDPDTWNEDFCALSPALVHHLAARGVRTVGIDTPSVDLMHDAELLSHHAIAEHDLAVLEGLVLHEVPPGDYTLVALPLKLADADASPVRAILLPPGALSAD